MNETRFEKNLVINNRELRYQGIFRADELFRTINRALEEKGYEKREKKTEELVTETGKKTYLELRPYKEASSYCLQMIKIKVTLDKVTETVKEVQGRKRKFQEGDVLIVFDSWLLTDYAGRWGMSPGVYFLKSFINKFLYTFPLERGFKNQLVQDTAYLYARIRKLLNSYQPETGKGAMEEEVKREMEEEVAKEVRESGP